MKVGALRISKSATYRGLFDGDNTRKMCDCGSVKARACLGEVSVYPKVLGGSGLQDMEVNTVWRTRWGP